MGEFEQMYREEKVGRFGVNDRVENQAGERVGVAKAPRLGLQQTATPTAKGSFGSCRV